MDTAQMKDNAGTSSVRIVWTIASKDIVDALKNRTILSIMLGVLLMLVSIQALPMLLKLDNRPRLTVYDPDRTLLGDLRRSDAVQAGGARSTAEVIDNVQSYSGPLLGLDLPAGLADDRGPLVVTGYLSHWVRANEAAELQAAAEAHLTALAGRAITVEVHPVYPEPGKPGRAAMLISGYVMAVMLTALIVVPFLFLEEREANTLALLTLSPASPGQVVAGKAIAGLAYSLAAFVVLLFFNLTFVVTWGLFLGGVLLGAVFAVMLGLLLGITAETHSGVNLWAALLAMFLILPASVASFAPALPAWAEQVLPWIPSMALAELLGLSFAATADLAQAVRPLALLLGMTLVLFLLVVWRCGRIAE